MSLFFLHPAFLYGLIAASVPLLIHLLNRRRLKRIRFPAVRFVLLSQRRISRSYRLRHWLLLALRTLAVALLVLLLANPIFQTGVGLFAGGGPVSLVVVLDNSLSMTWSADGAGFKQAKEAARLLISALEEGDRAAVISTNPSGGEAFRLKSEKEVLLRDLDAVEIAAGTADFPAVLSRAYELLNEPAAQKEIRLVTDLALTGWDRFSVAALKQYDPLIPFKILWTGKTGGAPNATLREIRLAGQGVGVGLPLQIETTVVNFGDREIKDVLVQLNIDGRNREQKLISVPAKGETAAGFQIKLAQPGPHPGQVTLKKEGLAGNATAHFALQAEDQLRVLVVDGDPQTSLVQSESFFLTRALNPAGARDSSLYLPTVIIPEGMNAVSLDTYQAVILCNVASISDGFAAKLRDYVRGGGGVLIFSGDRLRAEDFNLKLFQSAPPLLPAQIRDQKSSPETAAEQIGKVDFDHPALRHLSDPILQESLRSARVWSYHRTAAGAPLIALAGGDPVLLEQRVGAGRVLTFTTSADRDWNDLPLKTAYLPLIQSLTDYLAGGKRGVMDGGIAVGSPKEIFFPPAYVGKSLRITRPDKNQPEIPIVPAKDRAAAVYRDNDLAGVYQWTPPPSAEREPGMARLYAVNPPYLESRLDQIGAPELRAKLNPIAVEVIPLEALARGGTRTDLSLPLLGLLIITLLSEGWISQRV